MHNILRNLQIRSEKERRIRDHIPEVASLEQYQYDSLQFEDGIRLLILEPGNFGEALKAKLSCVRLGSPLYYEALSYCWGGDIRDKAIIVNGAELAITTNLFAALQTLRPEKSPRVLWA